MFAAAATGPRRRPGHASLAASSFLLAFVLSTGCSAIYQPNADRFNSADTGVNPPRDVGPDTNRPDADFPDADSPDMGLFDGGRDVGPNDVGTDASEPCSPIDCDDLIACTRDLCQNGVCMHTAENSRCTGVGEQCVPGQGCVTAPCVTAEDCSNGIFCDGVETCRTPTAQNPRGCGPSPGDPCVDNDVCTTNLCNETLRMCSTTPVDVDGDTYVAEFVNNRTCGNDCNDDDPTIHPGATEVCNGKDDDCDGETDEGCGETCGIAWPVVLSGGATGVFSSAFNTQDYRANQSAPNLPGCSHSGGKDVFFALTLTQLSDVIIDIGGSTQQRDVFVSVGTSCSNESLTSFVCNDDRDAFEGSSSNYNPRLLLHRVGPNPSSPTRAPVTYYVHVEAKSNGSTPITITFAVSPAPERDSCSIAPTLDISTGGTLYGQVFSTNASSTAPLLSGIGSCTSAPPNGAESFVPFTANANGWPDRMFVGTNSSLGVYFRETALCPGLVDDQITCAEVSNEVLDFTENLDLNASSDYHLVFDGFMPQSTFVQGTFLVVYDP